MAAQADQCDVSRNESDVIVGQNASEKAAEDKDKADEATLCKEKADANEKNYKDEAEVGSKSTGLTTDETVDPEQTAVEAANKALEKAKLTGDGKAEETKLEDAEEKLKVPKPSGIRACMMEAGGANKGKPLPECSNCVNTIIAFGAPYSPVPWTKFAINYMIPAGACLSCLGRAIMHKLAKTCFGDAEKKMEEEDATSEMFGGSCTQEQVGTCVLLAEASKCARRADTNASTYPFGVHYSYGIQTVLRSNSNRYKAARLHASKNKDHTWPRPIQKAEDNVCSKFYYETRSSLGYNTKERDCMGNKPNALNGCRDVQSMMRVHIRDFPDVGKQIEDAKDRAAVLKQCHQIFGCNREVLDGSEFQEIENAAATAKKVGSDSLIDMSLIEANAESMTIFKGAATFFAKVASFVKKIYLYVKWCKGGGILKNLYLGTGITLGMADIFSPAPASMNLIVRCMPLQACAQCNWAEINKASAPKPTNQDTTDAQATETDLWKEAGAAEKEEIKNPNEEPDNDGAVFLSVAETTAKAAKAAKAVKAEAKAAMVQRNEGRKTMRNLIHEMFGLRLSKHRGVMEQMEELERWERRERVRRAAAKAAKAQRRMGHRQDADLFMELSSQAAIKAGCENKNYNTGHQNKVLSSEEVSKLKYEDAKDFGYLAGVVDGPIRQNNKMILDEVFKAKTKSVPGADMAYPTMPYYDIGINNAFRHEGGCDIYGK